MACSREGKQARLPPICIVCLIACACGPVTVNSKITETPPRGRDETLEKLPPIFSAAKEADRGNPAELLSVWQTNAKKLLSPKNAKLLLQHLTMTELRNHPVIELFIPVPVHFIFVGFHGDGNYDVNIPPEEFKDWFEHLNHIVPYVRVPAESLSCQETGHCSSMHDAKRLPHTATHVSYNYTCHAVTVGEPVSKLFHEAISTLSRSIDPSNSDAVLQVDADAFDEFISGFIEGGNLGGAHNILVLNPKWGAKWPPYSYSSGLSPPEIQILLAHKKELKEQLKKVVRSTRAQRVTDRRNTWFSRPKGKFTVFKDFVNGGAWAADARHQLDTLTKDRNAALESIAISAARGVLSHLTWRLEHGSHEQAIRLDELINLVLGSDPSSYIDADLSSEDVGRLRIKLPYESCEVDAWVGSGRWLFLDLSAKASDWGPWVGGDGIKTKGSKPSVSARFSPSLSRVDPNVQQAQSKDLQRQLAKKQEERMQEVHAEHAMRMHVQQQTTGTGAVQEPPSGVPQLTLMRTELDVFQQFAIDHCSIASRNQGMCDRLHMRANALVSDILKLQMRGKAGTDEDAIIQEHGWNIFGSGHELDGIFLDEDDSPAGQARSSFKAELGAVVSSAMRHVITPPTTSWSDPSNPTHSSSSFSPKVLFSVYIVYDDAAAVRSHNPAATFGLETLKAEVERIRLPSQDFTWAVETVSSASEPALANAIATSMRHASARDPSKPPKSANSSGEKGSMFLASEPMAAQLRSNLLPRSRSHSKSGLLEVPVVVLMLQRNEALFVDEHYISRALKDMVIVVHNKQSLGVHPMGVTCGGSLVARKLSSPTAAALASITQFMAGVLPLHLGYSPLHDQVLHDWQWSVGQNPHSLTSQAPVLSQLQIDAIWRVYILDAVDISALRVTTALRFLLTEQPGAATITIEAGAKASIHAAAMVDLYLEMAQIWKSCFTLVEQLDFANAIHLTRTMDEVGTALMAEAMIVKDIVRPQTCKRAGGLHKWIASMDMDGSSDTHFGIMCIVAGLLFCGGLYWKRGGVRLEKPKIN